MGTSSKASERSRNTQKHASDNGCLETVDCTTGLEHWNGLNCCKKPFS